MGDEAVTLLKEDEEQRRKRARDEPTEVAASIRGGEMRKTKERRKGEDGNVTCLKTGEKTESWCVAKKLRM